MSARAEILPVFVPHLGCGHACVFCNQRRISGEKTPASAETVRRAVREAEGLPRAGKRELAFYGGSFTAIDGEKQEELLRAAKEALDAGKIDAIRLSTRPDAIDDKVLERLFRYGVETIELGAQSMDEGVLRLSRRGHTAADEAELTAAFQYEETVGKLLLRHHTLNNGCGAIGGTIIND